ncbi:MAG: hypothetical protein JWO80_1144 [Bryobacterales bacterium]|nr:hypothetical protein [Bryobacterales bacterium]
MLIFQVVTVFLIAVAMALSLAHALEYPGKMRLSKEAYLTTQCIYYPGFTIGGFGEALGLVATLVLLLLMPRGSQAFWWTLAGFLGLAAMQAIFWFVTQPVNRCWVACLPLTNAARSFFSVASKSGSDEGVDDRWERLRDKWEYSHIARAVFAAISLISLTMAVAIYGRS